MITVKSEKEIEKMRAVGKIVALAHEYIRPLVVPGVTLEHLDGLIEEFLLSNGAKPNCKNYNGFPKATCISVNDTVIHGIPDGYIIKDGDIVSIDFGAVKDGFHSDAARTVPVGKASKSALRLIEVTEQCFYEALPHLRAGRHLGDASNAIQACAEKNGYSVVRLFSGHGIGRALHEDPNVPNYGAAGSGPLLKAGYTIAVEPMINAGGFNVKILSDGWTVKTTDKSLSAHYENTLLITYAEPEILSKH